VTSSPPAFTSAEPTKAVTIERRITGLVKVCIEPANPTGNRATFSHPEDFSFEGTTDRCVTPQSTTIGQFSQNIVFTPSGEGPRYASLTAQRVASDGNALESANQALDFLAGNAGPFDSTTIAANLPTPPHCTVGTQLFAGFMQERKAGASTCSYDFTIRNVGSEIMRIESFVVNGLPLPAGSAATPVAPAEYPLASGFAGACFNGRQLAALNAASNCIVRVAFDPSDLRIRPAQLVITYSDVVGSATKRRTVAKDLAGIGFDGAELSVTGVTAPVPPATNSTIAYGMQNINVVYPQRIVFKNLGSDDDLSVSTVATPSASSRFDVVSPADTGCTGLLETPAQVLTLKPGASCTLDVRFLPTEAIAYTASFAVQSAPAGKPPVEFRADLSGTGANNIPVLVWKDTAGAATSMLDFRCPSCPATPVGTTSPPTQRIILENQGVGAAALKVLNIVGPDAASFAIDSTLTTCKFGEQLAPLTVTTCEVVVRFNPLSAGTKSASLQLVSTGTTPAPVQITADAAGTVGGVALVAQPNAIDFGLVRAGSESAPFTVTLTNNGSATAVVTAVDTGAPFVVKAGTCQPVPFALAPQAACTVTVTFAPNDDARATDALRVQLSGQSEPVTAALTGDGVEKADLASGGCTIVDSESPLDPTLWTMIVLAVAVLLNRRRSDRRDVKPKVCH
jgi:hypothetical protein